MGVLSGRRPSTLRVCFLLFTRNFALAFRSAVLIIKGVRGSTVIIIRGGPGEMKEGGNLAREKSRGMLGLFDEIVEITETSVVVPADTATAQPPGHP